MSLVRVIALGGVGEIGKNCTVVEQGDDMVLIDCGFGFPNEEMPGVDLVVPDFTYLVQNKHRLRGVFLTHAHEDHVGGLPYLLAQLKVPIYGTEFTHAMLRHKLEEKVGLKDLDLRIFKPGDIVQAGSLSVEPVRVTHSIPENCSLAVRTEHGILLFTGDFKFDFTPVDGKLSNMTRFGELGNEGVLCLFSDSTNVERPGWGPSEREVSVGLRKVFNDSPGRVLLTTFASNIHRMQQTFEVAAETGRKVAVVGRSMEKNLEVCQRCGYIKIPDGVHIRLDEARLLPDSKVALLTTGSQGEPMSALVQMSRGEYGRLQIKQGDTLVYSARPIPGNEGAIWRTINRLFRQGCQVIYDSATPIHVSGHAYQEELKMMLNLTRPFYVAPVHGEPRHQNLYTRIAKDMGYQEHRVFTMLEGLPLEFSETSAAFGEPVPFGRVLVDNSGNPGISDEIIRDRTNVAKDGLIAVTVVIDTDHGDLVGEPILQARGFNGAPGVLEAALSHLVEAIGHLSKDERRDVNRLTHDVSDVVRRLIHKRTQLRPLVVPTIVQV